MFFIKEIIKRILKKLPINFTQNQKYDAQTGKIILQHCKESSNCIDVGCHKGEVLDLMLKAAPNGQHYGFEPIPIMYQALVSKYAQQKNVTILPYALSNAEGEVSFNYVVSNPAYSGIVKRKYDRANEKEETITVPMTKLDDVLDEKFVVDIIKVDVEGGELQVLEGARKTLLRCRPLLIFEHG